MTKQTYYATRAGWVCGRYLRAGQAIELTEQQARYLTPPHTTLLSAQPPKPPFKPKTKVEPPKAEPLR